MCKHCWDYNETDHHKDFIRGGVRAEDFDDIPRYRHPKRRTKKKSARAKKNHGCTGNDNGPHVYVWTTETQVEDLFFRFYGYHKFEKEVCVGCRNYRRKQTTARYEKIRARVYKKMYGGPFDVKRGSPVPKYQWRNRKPSYDYFSWEVYDEKFIEYRRQYIEKYGENIYTMGNKYDWWTLWF